MNKERQIDEALSRLQSQMLANQEERKLNETARLREEERKKAEFERQRQKNIAALNATQIPQFFEEVAKAGLLVLDNHNFYGYKNIRGKRLFGLSSYSDTKYELISNFTPAKIEYGKDGSYVVFVFNETWRDYMDNQYEDHDCIVASLGESGQIIVDGKEIPEDQTPLEAVEERVQYWMDVNNKRNK